MVLTKKELIEMLQKEVRILLHLVSKVDLANVDYRPTSQQRSLLELLQYMTVFVPIHLRAIHSGVFNMDAWREAWQTEEPVAKRRNLQQIKDAIEKQPALFRELVEPLSDTELQAPMEMFGNKASRVAWIIQIVLCHYVAYRMQLFLYLKACGRGELNTMDLWVGVDAVAPSE
jgi:hypothetical protein